MIKVYEIKRKQAAQIVVNYFNVELKLMFDGGNVTRGNGATYSTDERFIQDAIEHDYRFGSTIAIKNVYRTEADIEAEKQAAAEAAVAAAQAAKAPKSGKGKGKDKAPEQTVSEDGAQVVEDCNDIDDVVEYFAQKGETATSNEDLKVLCEKYNVTFPNIKL